MNPHSHSPGVYAVPLCSRGGEGEEPVLSLMSMKALEEQLPEDRFVRVHRSYIIQPSAMSYIERGRVVFGKVRVPVSDTYRQELQDFLEKHSILLQTK